MMIGRRTLLALATAVALVAPAQAERWTGFAYSDNGATLRIVIRGPAGLNADGSVQLVGVFRCLGPTCIAHRGTASALFWNEAGTGLGHETVEITLRNGIACLSDSELNDSFHALPPLVGTEMGVSYVCGDAAGNIVDAGTISITRQR